MSSLSLWRSRSVALLVLALGTTAAPIVISAPARAANFNQGGLAPISSRLNASNYVVQVSTENNQSTNNGSSNQTVNNNLNTQNAEYRVPQGTAINVGYKASDKITVAPGETKLLVLTVAQDILNSKGEILIPKNSQIEGQIVPRYNGSSFLGAQFVAQRLTVGNQSYNSLNATSPLITAQQSTGPLGGLRRTIGDAAINSAAQVLVGRVTGQLGGVGDILGQTGNIGDILSQAGSLGGIFGQSGNVGGILGSVLTSGGSNQQQQNSQIVINPEKDLQLTVGSDFYVNTITQTPNYSVKTY